MTEARFSCRKCGIDIGGHNQYLHDGMCDGCFFEAYFPEGAQVFETDASKLPQLCRQQEKENRKFWKFLKSDRLDQERFSKIVKEIKEKTDCAKCWNCCKTLAPSLNDSDVTRISKHLSLSEERFVSEYLKKSESGCFEARQKPCPFFTGDKCRVYEERPESCRDYPYLDRDVTVRCHQFFENAEICPIAFNVLENAKEAFLEDIYEFENPDG